MKCIRCGSERVQAYGARVYQLDGLQAEITPCGHLGRFYCLACGFTWHPDSGSEAEEMERRQRWEKP